MMIRYVRPGAPCILTLTSTCTTSSLKFYPCQLRKRTVRNIHLRRNNAKLLAWFLALVKTHWCNQQSCLVLTVCGVNISCLFWALVADVHFVLPVSSNKTTMYLEKVKCIVCKNLLFRRLQTGSPFLFMLHVVILVWVCLFEVEVFLTVLYWDHSHAVIDDYYCATASASVYVTAVQTWNGVIFCNAPYS